MNKFVNEHRDLGIDSYPHCGMSLDTLVIHCLWYSLFKMQVSHHVYEGQCNDKRDGRNDCAGDVVKYESHNVYLYSM